MTPACNLHSFMGLKRASNGHNGQGHWRGERASASASDWAGRPFLLAGLMVGLGLLWSRVTGKTCQLETVRPATPRKQPRHAHEHRDVSVGWIFVVVAFLAISGVAIHFLMAGLLHVLNESKAPEDKWRPTQSRGVISEGKVANPPYPLLQVSPPLDLERFRTQEEKELNTYGWVNQSSGVVRIPIGAAMDLLLKKGLPVRNNDLQKPGPSSYDLMLKRVDRELGQETRGGQ